MTLFNRVILTGRVAKPPQRHYRPDGSPVLQFPLELKNPEDVAGRGGRNLIQIVAFGKLAEDEFGLLQNGQGLLVEGQLKQRHWQTPEGKKQTRTEVIATNLKRVEEMNSTIVLSEKGEKNEKT